MYLKKQFIYPIPRNEGYELMVGEFSEHQFYLTSVINYQVGRLGTGT